jgi:hypothetical protein
MVCLIVVAIAAAGEAQRRGGFFGTSIRTPTPTSFDGRFNFCRVAFSYSNTGDGGGWYVDYPRADINLSIRLSELTKTSIGMDPSGEPNHLVVRLTDPELFKCPFIMMTEVGAAYFSPEEAQHLREYLLKGGFLWVDDFWGTLAWEHWSREIGKAMPPSEYPITDVTLDDPMLRTLFDVKKIPQITNIQFWRSTGGTITSERGADSAEVHFRAIRDRRGAIVVLMTHNTDVADSWEREGEDPAFFYQFSPAGYSLGINVLLHIMSH